MDYYPNIDAVTRFAAQVLPRVRAVDPDAEFVIVGHRPVARVKRVNVTRYRRDVAARIADVYQAVRRNGRHRDRHTRPLDVENAIPKQATVRGAERDGVHVRRSAEQHAIHVGETAIHTQRARCLAVPH